MMSQFLNPLACGVHVHKRVGMFSLIQRPYHLAQLGTSRSSKRSKGGHYDSCASPRVGYLMERDTGDLVRGVETEGGRALVNAPGSGWTLWAYAGLVSCVCPASASTSAKASWIVES